ncbi:MAG: uncharacterized protein KVP18_004345 [Porospora cf. gigantea A]|uniref:uncharacterized protein n=1 Tax=Porospora cf. gigantea A TaxID=2853593 RepID=UPI003559D034|nr:MAG: hypothetical protein KVP18_004345 [Porospora cf. gigantea A]
MATASENSKLEAVEEPEVEVDEEDEESSYEYIEYDAEGEATPFMDEARMQKWAQRGKDGVQASSAFLLNQYRNAKAMAETHPKKVIVVLMIAKVLILISSIWETVMNLLGLDVAQIMVNLVLSVYVVLSLLVDMGIMLPSMPGLQFVREVCHEWLRFLYHRLGRGMFHLTLVVLAISPGVFTSSIIEMIGMVPLVVFAIIDIVRGATAVWQTNKTLRELAAQLQRDVEMGSDDIMERLGMPSVSTGDIEALETNIVSGMRFALKHFGPHISAEQTEEVCRKFNIPLNKTDLQVIFDEEAKGGKIKTSKLQQHIWTEITQSPPDTVKI